MGNKLRSVFFCLFLTLPVLQFLSCSNSAQDLVIEEDIPTLRYTADSLYNSTVWTEELEIDRLTSKVSSVAGVSSKLNLTPLILLAQKPSAFTPVFPVLDSFGSLDTTLISKSLREMLSSFAESVSVNSDADSFMSKDCLYSLSLFYSDFTRIFSGCFDFSDQAVSSAESDETQFTKKHFFTSFVLGQPFVDGVSYEVPLKFFCDKATMTLSVFCVEQSGSWKIEQIQICDWEIINGKD